MPGCFVLQHMSSNKTAETDKNLAQWPGASSSVAALLDTPGAHCFSMKPWNKNKQGQATSYIVQLENEPYRRRVYDVPPAFRQKWIRGQNAVLTEFFRLKLGFFFCPDVSINVEPRNSQILIGKKWTQKKSEMRAGSRKKGSDPQKYHLWFCSGSDFNPNLGVLNAVFHVLRSLNGRSTKAKKEPRRARNNQTSSVAFPCGRWENKDQGLMSPPFRSLTHSPRTRFQERKPQWKLRIQPMKYSIAKYVKKKLDLGLSGALTAFLSHADLMEWWSISRKC